MNFTTINTTQQAAEQQKRSAPVKTQAETEEDAEMNELRDLLLQMHTAVADVAKHRQLLLSDRHRRLAELGINLEYK